MHVILGKDHGAVDHDVEDSVAALDELGFDAERALDIGRQTGGPWQVLSTTAIGDGNLHLRAPGFGRLDERDHATILLGT